MSQGQVLLLVTSERSDVLKARLPLSPRHPRALLTLIEGLSLWSGQPLTVVVSTRKIPMDSRILSVTMGSPPKRQVSIRLPAALLRELDRRARLRRSTRASVIRAALDAYVALRDSALEEQPVQQVRDLIGSLKGLPRDLASNASHYLADLGAYGR